MPSEARLAAASGVGANRQRARWSLTMRLTSSGMRRSNERSPASMWAIGTVSLAATSDPANVEFVSP